MRFGGLAKCSGTFLIKNEPPETMILLLIAVLVAGFLIGGALAILKVALAFRKGYKDAVAQQEFEASLPVRTKLDWPQGYFRVHDELGEHDPCWLIDPNGHCHCFNQHAVNGVDQARAQWIADLLNEALGQPLPVPPQETETRKRLI